MLPEQQKECKARRAKVEEEGDETRGKRELVDDGVKASLGSIT